MPVHSQLLMISMNMMRDVLVLHLFVVVVSDSLSREYTRCKGVRKQEGG